VIEEPDNLIFKQLHILRQLKRDKLLEDEVVIKLQEKLALEYITSLNTETSVSPVKSINNRDMKARASIARKIQIFLASSEELREDRDKFEIYFRQLNDELLDKGLYLVIKRWENFLDAMSETRLQDEYNKAVKGCDIFVSLFFTKTGKFTEEEFDTAHDQFKDTGKPLIYTFFKSASVNIDKVQEKDLLSLWAFKKRLNDLGHFYTPYTSTDDLKLRFRDQLDKLLEGLLRE
jgi:hypothetical protein